MLTPIQTAKWAALLWVVLGCVQCGHSWYDSEDFELFDLVEEVNQNFYELLELNQTATTAEIKKAFRVLSLKLHPDKSKEEDAERKFRNLVSVTEVLKDEKKRAKYEEVLVNGLPSWKSGAFYYRRARKLGLFEMTLIVSLILTFGHYLCIIAAYWEKNYEVNELLEKRGRKLKKEELVLLKEEMMEQIGSRRPRLLQDNLPVKLTKWLIRLVREDIPSLVAFILQAIKERAEEKKRLQQEAEESLIQELPRVRKPKVRPELPEFSDLYGPDKDTVDEPNLGSVDAKPVQLNNHLGRSEWTEEDILSLIKWSKKFPGGVPSRWERIAEAMGRSVDNVTKMAKKVKSGEIPVSNINTEKTLVEKRENEATTASLNKMMTTDMATLREDPSVASAPSFWSQGQQSCLEKALQKHPKGSDARWDNVAALVPGKSKEECMVRFKHLAELVKKKTKGNRSELTTVINR